MEFNPKDLDKTALYKLLTGAVVPRPIGWISSVSASGASNLAPYSFFNVLTAKPPLLMFCPGVTPEGRLKDSYLNAKETGEFVVNIVNKELGPAMNETATDYDHEVSEFKEAGLKQAPSTIVKAPRVQEALVHFECQVQQILPLGDKDNPSGHMVIGEVVYIHIHDEVFIEPHKINLQRLNPIGRLSGKSYCDTSDTFELTRQFLNKS